MWVKQEGKALCMSRYHEVCTVSVAWLSGVLRTQKITSSVLFLIIQPPAQMLQMPHINSNWGEQPSEAIQAHEVSPLGVKAAKGLE